MKDAIYIPTGMYGGDTEKILNALHNTMQRSYQTQYKFRCYGLAAVSFERAPDNEILLKLSSDDGYGRVWRFWSSIVKQSFYINADTILQSEAKAVLEKFGWNIKLLAREFAQHHMTNNVHVVDEKTETTAEYQKRFAKYFKKNFWSRSSDINIKNYLPLAVVNNNLHDVNVAVADIYFLYEKLIGRLEKSTKCYDKAIVHRLVGEPRDVISTEAEAARREEIKHIEDEYQAKIDDLSTTYVYGKHRSAYDELQKIINEFKAKCVAKQNELKAERDAKIAEVNAACQFLTV